MAKQHLRSFHPALTDEVSYALQEQEVCCLTTADMLYSNATEQFDNNFAADILMLRQEYEVKLMTQSDIKF